jgi:hypothetical protein
MIAGECRVCGCTEEQACAFFEGRRLTDRDLEQLEVSDPLARELAKLAITTCSWVEADLCSGCVEEPAPPPLLFDAHGQPLRGAP